MLAKPYSPFLVVHKLLGIRLGVEISVYYEFGHFIMMTGIAYMFMAWIFLIEQVVEDLP